MTTLLKFMSVAVFDQNTFKQAFSLEYTDLEDSVQMITSMQCKADFLITRNIKDFQPPLLPVIQPVDFLPHSDLFPREIV